MGVKQRAVATHHYVKCMTYCERILLLCGSLLYIFISIKRFKNDFQKLLPLHEVAPSTSVPSERVFSATGNIATKKRGSLLPENVNCLVFLNKNLLS